MIVRAQVIHAWAQLMQRTGPGPDSYLNCIQVGAVFCEWMAGPGPLGHLLGVLGQLLPLPFQNLHVQIVGVHSARFCEDAICTFHDLARLESVGGVLLVVHGILVHLFVGRAFFVEVFRRNGTLGPDLLELGLVVRSGWGLL